jgi:hypothetical protein
MGAAAAGGLAVGCSSSSKPPPTVQCILASDCKDVTKQCVQGYCVGVCTTSQDCPSGQRCVKYADTTGAAGAAGDTGGAGGATGATVPVSAGNICQVPEIKTCALNSDCTPGLFCAKDLQCRNMCNADVDCLGGVSSANPPKCTISHYCVDPIADASNYDPTTNDLKPAVSAGGTTGSAGAGGKSSGAGGAGGKGAAKPSFAFSAPLQGDTNPNFVAGVAARLDGRLVIFSGYSGPPVSLGAGGSGAGGAAPTTANYIFAQAFDTTTGAALAAATPLFQVADGSAFNIWNVAVSSAGDIALLYGNGYSQNFNTNLYVAFLTSSSAAGPLPAPGVQLKGAAIPIESTGAGDVSAFWSEATQEFVFSWKYNTNGYQIRTRKFLADGSPAGGDTGAVSVVPQIDDYTWQQGMGASGTLFAVGSRAYSTGLPFLALLDINGNAVGSPVQISGGAAGRWVNVGGTTNGFVFLFQDGSAAKINGTYIPKLPDGSGVVVPAGAGGAGGAGGDSGAGGGSGWNTFTVPSTATGYNAAYTISDELGAGGTGTVFLEANGASFLYVEADGKTLHSVGTVLSSSTGSWTSITNYRGSFSVSLFESAKHATQAAASR